MPRKINLEDIADIIDCSPRIYYGSSECIVEEYKGKIKIHLRPDKWKEFVSNSLIKGVEQ